MKVYLSTLCVALTMFSAATAAALSSSFTPLRDSLPAMGVCANSAAPSKGSLHPSPLPAMPPQPAHKEGAKPYQFGFLSENTFLLTRTGDEWQGEMILPNLAVALDYDFGHGWSFGTEAVFEYGSGAEDGAVSVEQFWLQHSWSPHLNLRAGHLVVPIGSGNAVHLPDEYFGVLHPESETALLPYVWHQSGLSLWGTAGARQQWRYEMQLLPALSSSGFDKGGWVSGGNTSPYVWHHGDPLAMAVRIDHTAPSGLRLSLSGYAGNTIGNDSCRTTIALLAFNLAYSRGGLQLRGNALYGYLHNALTANPANPAGGNATGSNASVLSPMGQGAYSAGAEVGYDLLHNRSWSSFGKGKAASQTHAKAQSETMAPSEIATPSNAKTQTKVISEAESQAEDEAKAKAEAEATAQVKAESQAEVQAQKLILFVRYDLYDSYLPATGDAAYPWSRRHLLAAGINYSPLPGITVKAECGLRHFAELHPNEPWLAIGLTWEGLFD